MSRPKGESDANDVPRQPSPSELLAQRIFVLLQSAHEENQVTAALEVGVNVHQILCYWPAHSGETGRVV
jgi:cephalosporin hydroxylase